MPQRTLLQTQASMKNSTRLGTTDTARRRLINTNSFEEEM